jgi:hypothetical protein
MYLVRNRTIEDCTYLLACPSVEDNQKSAALNLCTGADSRSRTPVAAHSLNLRPGEDQAAAMAQLNFQPGKD